MNVKSNDEIYGTSNTIEKKENLKKIMSLCMCMCMYYSSRVVSSYCYLSIIRLVHILLQKQNDTTRHDTIQYNTNNLYDLATYPVMANTFPKSVHNAAGMTASK